MRQKSDVWDYILDHICQGLPETVIKTWFEDTHILSIEENCLTLYTPPPFKRDIIYKRYVASMKEALYNLYGREYEIVVKVGGEEEPKPVQNEADASEEPFTFSNFVVGPSNNFAHAAAAAVADAPGVLYNPLFIYGGSGLGKTHLLYAIRHKMRVDKPGAQIASITSERFTRELISAIESGQRSAFHDKYRFADMLLVDDIQFIASKDFAQEEFFHTFNTLHEAGHQIVLTSDRPPKDMSRLEERLRTRFEMGLVVDVQPPDFETRMAIIKVKATHLQLILPENVAEYVATTVTANVRQLEGTVKKIMAMRDLLRLPVDIETAQRAIADLQREHPGLNPTPDLIVNEVCRFYDVELREILGNSRKSKINAARQAAMFLTREITHKSLQDIGQFFNRDHTTVLHACDRIQQMRDLDADLQNDLRMITDNIRGQ